MRASSVKVAQRNISASAHPLVAARACPQEATLPRPRGRCRPVTVAQYGAGTSAATRLHEPSSLAKRPSGLPSRRGRWLFTHRTGLLRCRGVAGGWRCRARSLAGRVSSVRCSNAAIGASFRRPRTASSLLRDVSPVEPRLPCPSPRSTAARAQRQPVHVGWSARCGPPAIRTSGGRLGIRDSAVVQFKAMVYLSDCRRPTAGPVRGC